MSTNQEGEHACIPRGYMYQANIFAGTTSGKYIVFPVLLYPFGSTSWIVRNSVVAVVVRAQCQTIAQQPRMWLLSSLQS